jgi:hypothetical protein
LLPFGALPFQPIVVQPCLQGIGPELASPLLFPFLSKARRGLVSQQLTAAALLSLGA